MIKFESEIAGVPDDAMINASVVVVQYFAEDGSMAWAVKTGGDVPFSQWVGLMECAKHSIMEGHNRE